MEITLPWLVVNFLVTFYSVLFVYLVIVYPGPIQYSALEGHPDNYKKRKAIARSDEEIILSNPVDIELPENLVEEFITFKEEELIPIPETMVINYSNQEANKVSAPQKSHCERQQTEFEMWAENEQVITSIKK